MNCWINGQQADSIAVTHRGLAYGDGIFETVAVRKGKLLLWEQHLERMQKGLSVLKINADMALLKQEIDQVLSESNSDNTCLKVMILRGDNGKRGYAPDTNVTADRILQTSTYQVSADPVRLKQCETLLADKGVLKGLKTLNSLEYVVAAAELGDEYDDGVLCDSDGRLIEATKSNLFWVNSSGVLVTPQINQCGIPGVVRDEIIKRAPMEGIPVKVTAATSDALSAAREIFLTNSLIGVQSVREYQGKTLSDHDMADTIRDLLYGDIFPYL